MDSKGQAYSTFKLLIAAIVAMAILGILIPIIMQVMGLIKANPSDETKSLLSKLVDSPGELGRTKEVVFERGSALAASALAERLAVTKSQICMSTGQFESDEDAVFEWKESSDRTEQRILYHGQTDQQARIAVVCNVSLSALENDIDFYDLVYREGNDIEDACQICEQGGKCCAIILEKS